MQVRTGDHHETVGLQHAPELGQRQQDLVRIKMLDVVAGKQRIDRCVGHRRHVEHGADNVRFGIRVDVEAQLSPFGGIESASGTVLVLGATADVQKSSHVLRLVLLFLCIVPLAAPRPPHAAQGGFEVAGKARGIEDRRSQHLLPQARTQRRQARQVAGMGRRTRHVVVGIARDPLRQAGVHQQAQTLALQEAACGQGQHRHPHPQAFHRGGAAREREAIEDDIHALVSGQVPGPRREAFQDQPAGVYAVGRKTRRELLPHVGVVQLLGLEQHLALRHRLQYPGPQRDHGVVQLVRILEAAEGDPPGGECGQRRDVDRHVGHGEAQPGFRQAPDLLGEVGFFGVGQGPGIGDQVVDLRHPGRREIPQPAHLHRRRLPGEERQAVVCGVAGEVDQDVDFVIADLPRQLLIRNPHHRAPDPAAGLDPFRQRVGQGMIAVGDDVQASHESSGKFGKYAFDEVADRVFAQVARHQAHPQTPLRQRAVGPVCIGVCPPAGDVAKTPCMRQQILRRLIGEVVVGE